jgi:hypothetical protein
VTYTGGAALFTTSTAGIAKAVTATGLGLSGADAGNYTVNSLAVTTATISAVAAPPAVVSMVIRPLNPVVKMMIDAENLIPPAATLNLPVALMPGIVAGRLPPQLSSVMQPFPPTALLPPSAQAALAEAQ